MSRSGQEMQPSKAHMFYGCFIHCRRKIWLESTKSWRVGVELEMSWVEFEAQRVRTGMVNKDHGLCPSQRSIFKGQHT